MFGLFFVTIMLFVTPTIQVAEIQKDQNVELKEAVEIYVDSAEPLKADKTGNYGNP